MSGEWFRCVEINDLFVVRGRRLGCSFISVHLVYLSLLMCIYTSGSLIYMWLVLFLYSQSELINKFQANGLNWSGLLHAKWSELISILRWQMVWIDQDVYMANGLNWSGLWMSKLFTIIPGKGSELIQSFTWQLVWIDQD